MSKKRRITAIVVIMVILTGAFFCLAAVTDDISLRNVYLSVGVSLLSSSLFFVFTELLIIKNNEDKCSLIVSRMEQLEKIANDGIMVINKRSEFSTEFWMEFLKETQNELISSGRSLHRWTDNAELKKCFKNAIIRVIDSGGTIKLLMYKDVSLSEENIQHKSRFLKFIENEVLSKLVSQLKCKGKLSGQELELIRSRFIVKEVDILPYLYTYNGKRAVVNSYFSATKISGLNADNLVMVFEPGTVYERPFRTDFDCIFNKADPSSKLNEYFNTAIEKLD